MAPVRGNVQTRLRKLDEGQYAALVLAAAGLRRLGLEERIARYFTTEEMIPAAGQGILAVQVRAGEDVSWLERFRDKYPHIIWINPSERPSWGQYWCETYDAIARVFPMFPLTVDGLEAGMKKLLAR